MSGWLYDLMLAPEKLFALGVVLIVLGLVTLIWMFIGRIGNVTLGPDPVIPLSEATTVEMHLESTGPIQPNYTREFRLDEYYPLADEPKADNTITHQLQAVAAYFERVETVTVTREVYIAIPGPRHRLEDVHAPTQNLTDVIRRAKESAR